MNAKQNLQNKISKQKLQLFIIQYRKKICYTSPPYKSKLLQVNHHIKILYDYMTILILS